MNDESRQDDSSDLDHALEKPEGVIDDIVSGIEDIRKALSRGTIGLGYAKLRFLENRGEWSRFSGMSASSPEETQVYVSGVKVLLRIRDEVRNFKADQLPGITKIDTLIGTVDFMSTATSSTASVFPTSSQRAQSVLVSGEPPTLDFVKATLTPLQRTEHERTSKRLAKLDPNLAKTYEECWQAVYGTTADPERAALWQMRQVFDHLFEILVPDDDLVLESEYWKHKTEVGEEDSGKVKRSDRIKFAASQIEDQNRVETLIASVDHMDKTYNALNYAHKRGKIDAQKAWSTLHGMQVLFEKWLDALNL